MIRPQDLGFYPESLYHELKDDLFNTHQTVNTDFGIVFSEFAPIWGTGTDKMLNVGSFSSTDLDDNRKPTVHRAK